MDKINKAHLPVLLELIRFIRPYRKTLLGAFIALVFTAGISLSIGQGVRMLIDDGFKGNSSAGLNQAVGFIVLMTSLMAVGTFVRFYLISWLGERVSADLRRVVFEHLLTLHPSYFEMNRSGEIMSRLTTDTTLLQSIIGSSLSMAVRSALTFIGALLLMTITNLKLTLIVLAGVPLILLPVLFYGRRVRNLSRSSQDSIASVGTYAGEIIQHIKTVQSYTREGAEVAAFTAEVEQAFDVAKRRIRQRALLIAAVIVMVFGALSGMLWIGGSDVLSGAMSGGELGAFVFYAMMVGSAVATWSEVYGELQRAAGATERLLDLLHVESAIASPVPTGATGNNSAHHIEVVSRSGAELNAGVGLKGVHFCYPSRLDKPALVNFELEVEPGQNVALVGPSGAGKTTVFELLQRFYDPQQGQVTLGGTDVRCLEPADLRRQMALVSQQPALFTTDVMQNIRYGDAAATDEQVYAAARAAYADDFIRELPEGYQSHLGEQGVRLSGGQRQRIAIARALLKNPRILLLDEATSALDAQSEQQVQRALARLMQDRTTLIIAHRLATILHVDRIVVMDQGRAVAAGSHQSLQRDSALYRRLARLQFQGGLNEAAAGYEL